MKKLFFTTIVMLGIAGFVNAQKTTNTKTVKPVTTTPAVKPVTTTKPVVKPVATSKTPLKADGTPDKRFQERSDRLATLVNDEVEKTGRLALGVSQRQKGIWVLQATNMPAILIETGFINNPEDERYLNSEDGQQELAEAITKAVIHYKEQIENSSKSVIETVPEKVKADKPVASLLDTRITTEEKVLQVKSENIKVEIYDDGEIDNDIVSVYFNNTLLVDKKTLSAQAYTLNLNLEKGKTNELVLYADNLGEIPPNTALMVITDGINRFEVRLSADLKKNASVRFEFKNNN